jgi:hypothetical protein
LRRSARRSICSPRRSALIPLCSGGGPGFLPSIPLVACGEARPRRRIYTVAGCLSRRDDLNE